MTTLDLTQNQRVQRGGDTIIDANHSSYKLQPEGNSLVYVEKVLIKKDNYKLPSLGRSKKDKIDCYFFKQDNFTDIGGGYATVLRHYARRPDPWFNFEPVTVLLYNGNPNILGINYDYGGGFLPYGFSNLGFLSYFYRRNFTYLAKATRYYLTKTEIEAYIDNNFALNFFGASGEFHYSSIYPDARIPSFPSDASRGDGAIIKINTSNLGVSKTLTFPEKLFVNPPRAKLSSSEEKSDEIVVAQDKISKYVGDIYEVIRHTASINYNIPPAGKIVPLNAQLIVTSTTRSTTQGQRDSVVANVNNLIVPNNQLVVIDEKEGDERDEEFTFNIQLIIPTNFPTTTFSTSILGSNNIDDSLTQSFDPSTGILNATQKFKWNGNRASIVVKMFVDLSS